MTEYQKVRQLYNLPDYKSNLIGTPNATYLVKFDVLTGYAVNRAERQKKGIKIKEVESFEFEGETIK